MQIIDVLTQTVQSLSTLLILGGMLIAFLWKAAAIINLVFGLIITLLATYVAYTLTGNLFGVGAVFLIGLMVTGVVAALGALACVLEGFALSVFGFWGVFVSGSPSNVFSSGMILVAVLASAISTGIAVFIGGRVISTRNFKVGKKRTNAFLGKQGTSPYHGGDKHNDEQRFAPIKVQVLPETQVLRESDFPRRSFIVDRGYCAAKKNKASKQLDKLNIEISRGRIDKVTGDRLQAEIKMELLQLDEEYAVALNREFKEHTQELTEIDAECLRLKNRVSNLREEERKIMEERIELDARFKIKQLSRRDYGTRRRTLAEKIEQIRREILVSNNRIGRLEGRKEEVNSIISNNRNEIKNG